MRRRLPTPLVMYEITTPLYARKPFCAGVLVAPGGRVSEAAPILKWTLGMQISYVVRECQRRGWKVERVP